MKKKIYALLLIGGLLGGLLSGCGKTEITETSTEVEKTSSEIISDMEEGEPVEYVYSDDKIDLAPYKGLPSSTYTDTVTDERVNEYITYILGYTYGSDEEGNMLYTVDSLTEDIVAEIGGQEMSVDEYKELVKNTLREEDESYFAETQRTNLFQLVVDLSVLKEYEEEELTKYVEYLDSFYQLYAEDVNVSFEDFKKDSLGYETDEDYQAALKEEAEYNLKTETVIKTICEQEGIEVTQEDKDALVQDFVDMGYANTEEEALARMSDEDITMNAMYYKVLDLIVGSAVAE